MTQKLLAALAAIACASAGCSAERHLVGLAPGAITEDGGVDAPVRRDVGVDLGADASGGDGAVVPGVRELWAEFVDITCFVMKLCCNEEEKRNNALAGSYSFCKSKITNNRAGLADMLALSILESIAEGRAVYHPERVPACETRLTLIGCDEALSLRELRCDEVIEPKVPVGQPCTTAMHYECIAGFCDFNVCAAKKQDGQQCYVNAECISGFCPGGGMGGVCSVLVPSRALCAP